MDALVEADVDSALVVMGRTPSEDWSRRDAMRLELLRAKAMNRADSLFTTDSLMLRVAEYYQHHGSRNDRMLSLYLLGSDYIFEKNGTFKFTKNVKIEKGTKLKVIDSNVTY